MVKKNNIGKGAQATPRRSARNKKNSPQTSTNIDVPINDTPSKSDEHSNKPLSKSQIQTILKREVKIILQRIDAVQPATVADLAPRRSARNKRNVPAISKRNNVTNNDTPSNEKPQASSLPNQDNTKPTGESKKKTTSRKNEKTTDANVVPRRSARNKNNFPQTTNVTSKKQTMPKVALKQKQRKSRNLTLKERIDLEALDKFFVLNEIVLATVPGYSPWPARIIGIDGATIKVEFFGTGERNPLRANAISRFEFNRIVPLMDKKGFKKAVRELEMTLRVPQEFSAFTSLL